MIPHVPSSTHLEECTSIIEEMHRVAGKIGMEFDQSPFLVDPYPTEDVECSLEDLVKVYEAIAILREMAEEQYRKYWEIKRYEREN